MMAALACAVVALAQAPASPPPDPAAAAAQTPATAEHVAAIKGTLQKDQAALKQYEWIETTVMSLKGEEKSRKQNRCYYSAEGKLAKVPVGEQPEEKDPRGLRGKKAAGKKEEISDYMSKAAEAIKSYVPPDPARIQACKDAGKASVAVLEPGKRVRLDFHDYQVPGDLLGIELDLATNRLLMLQVTTMVEGGKEPVTFRSDYGAFTDGTGYPMKTALDAKEIGVAVVVENSGYKKQASN
jgi:hypothetical protein